MNSNIKLSYKTFLLNLEKKLLLWKLVGKEKKGGKLCYLFVKKYLAMYLVFVVHIVREHEIINLTNCKNYINKTYLFPFL